MDITTVVIGSAAVIFGIITLFLRAVKPRSFSKLAAMKERFGDRPGTIIHVLAYSIVPIVAGAIIASAGFAGQSLFGG